MKQNYVKLLDTDDWKEKRKEILVRDKFTCQRCGSSYHKTFETQTQKKLYGAENRNYSTEDFRCKFVQTIYYGNAGLILKSPLSDSEIKQNPRVGIVINFVDKDRISYPFEGSLLKSQVDPEFYKRISDDPFLNNILRKKFIKDGHLDIDLEGLWLSNNHLYPLYRKDKWLHVHHKCYRAGVDIWDQPDGDYISLCNVCHHIVHERELIPYYSPGGEIYQFLQQCDRCSGKGYFRHYKHVQNGTCFKCGGMGLVEKDDL